MLKSPKVLWFIIILLLAIILLMAKMFLLSGSTITSSDERTAIVLLDGERDIVLGEMREFLEAVQIITTAAAEDDMETLAKTARTVGSASIGGVPTTLMGKLPLEFKTLGFETHSLFDDLAQTAEDGGDTKALMGSLGDLLLNCTSCHSGYKLVGEPAN